MSIVNQHDPRITCKSFVDGTKFIVCRPETEHNPTPACVLPAGTAALALVSFSKEGLVNHLKRSPGSNARPRRMYLLISNGENFWLEEKPEFTLTKLNKSAELRNQACSFFRYDFHEYVIAEAKRGNKKLFGYIHFKNRAQQPPYPVIGDDNNGDNTDTESVI